MPGECHFVSIISIYFDACQCFEFSYILEKTRAAPIDWINSYIFGSGYDPWPQLRSFFNIWSRSVELFLYRGEMQLALPILIGKAASTFNRCIFSPSSRTNSGADSTAQNSVGSIGHTSGKVSSIWCLAPWIWTSWPSQLSFDSDEMSKNSFSCPPWLL